MGHTKENESQQLLDDQPPVQLYFRRWIVLAIFSVLGFANQYQWVTFSPVPDVTSELYGVSYGFVNLCSLTYYLAYVTFVLPSFWMIDRLGFRWILLISAGLNAVAAPVKFLAHSKGFAAFTLIGSSLAALGQVPILGTPPFLSALWFGDRERGTATAIGFLMLNTGVAVGLLVQPLFVKNRNNDVVPSFFYSYGFETALTTIGAILVILFVPDKPLSAPSPTSTQFDTTSYESFFSTLKQWSKLFTNYYFLLLDLCFACVMGSFWAFTTVFAEVLCPFGYSNQDMGLMGSVNVFAGLLSTFLIGAFLDKWRQTGSKYFSYRIPLVAILIAATMAYGGFLYFLYKQHTSPDSGGATYRVELTIVYAVVGALINAAIPVALEHAVELTYPAMEAHIGGTLMGSANLLGISLVFSFTRIITGSWNFFSSGNGKCLTTAAQQKRSLVALIIQVAAVGSGALVACFVGGRLRRYEQEQKHPIQNINDVDVVHYGVVLE